MDWKDKLKEISSTMDSSNTNNTGSMSPFDNIHSNENGPAHRKEVKVSVHQIRKRMFQRRQEAAKEFYCDVKELEGCLKKANYKLYAYNPKATSTPRMYIHLCKTYKTDFFRYNKVNFSKAIDLLLGNGLDKSKNQRTSTQKKQDKGRTISPSTIIPETNKTQISHRTMPAASSDDNKVIYVHIPLEEILFDNYLIRVRLDKHISLPFSCPESRKSFYLLKKYFKNLHFDKLVIIAQGKTIKAIENISHLRQCSSYLSIVDNYLVASKVDEATKSEHIIEN